VDLQPIYEIPNRVKVDVITGSKKLADERKAKVLVELRQVD
jgi:hypothetical protein